MIYLTLKIEVSALFEVIQGLEKDVDGFASMKAFLEKAAAVHDCTVLTIRNFVYKHSSEFEWKHGLIRTKLIQSLPEQKLDLKEFEDWSSNRIAVLDECLQFLQVQTPSPYIENLLVLAGSTRDEFKSYSDSSLAQLIFDLRREFGFVPQIILKEGEVNKIDISNDNST